MHNVILKKYYFINKFNINNIDKLEKNTIIIYRNYKKKKVTNDVIKLKKYCKVKGIKLYISNNIKLAMKMNVAGVYIPSFNKDFRHLSFTFKKNFKIIGSAHNIKEMRLKEKQCVEYIFISSLFKNNKNFLGFNKFNNLKKMTKKKIIALGGVSKSNLKQVKLLSCSGFSGIRYFE